MNQDIRSIPPAPSDDIDAQAAFDTLMQGCRRFREETFPRQDVYKRQPARYSKCYCATATR